MAEGGDTPERSEAFFQPLSADNEITEIESVCVSCFKQGVTKLMLTKIPFFRDIIVSSFSCPHCFFQNSNLNSNLELAATGIVYDLNVEDRQDLNRIVVKSDYASVSVPELDLEIMAESAKGDVTTVEGILKRVMTGLVQDQQRRKEDHPEDYKKIQAYLKRVEDCIDLKTKFTMTIRDITGNSFVGHRPDTVNISVDPNLGCRRFLRSKAEDLKVGIAEINPIAEETSDYEDATANLKNEVLKLQTDCPDCGAPCVTKMKVTDIPHFKEVVIMATDCDKCGSRTNEVKPSGGLEPLGKRIKLKVKEKVDFSRDLLKSDTCYVEIPELDLQAGSGAIIGKFTTIEGLLLDIKKQLSDENPLVGGDSVDPTMKEKMANFCKQLDELLAGGKEFTLVLDDPTGNSWIQNIYAPEEDPFMEIETYERTFEQNEELGINDMNVESQDENVENQNEAEQDENRPS